MCHGVRYEECNKEACSQRKTKGWYPWNIFFPEEGKVSYMLFEYILLLEATPS